MTEAFPPPDIFMIEHPAVFDGDIGIRAAVRKASQ